MISNRIMDAIAALPRDFSVARNERSNPKWTPDHFGRFALGGPFHARGIRFGLAVASAMIVLVFFIQESLVLSKISRLEERMATVTMAPAVTMPTSSVISLTPDEIKNVPGSAFGIAAMEEEWVAVRRADLETLLRSVQDSRRFNTLLLKIIQKKYPAIRRLDEEMALDSGKVIRILRENPALIQQFLQSTVTGGQT
jgi:hypothetical protein